MKIPKRRICPKLLVNVLAGQAEGGAGQHRTVEYAKASTNHCLSVPGYVPGKANARTKIIAVRIIKRLADGIEGQCRDIEIADLIALQHGVVFIAQTEIQS